MFQEKALHDLYACTINISYSKAFHFQNQALFTRLYLQVFYFAFYLQDFAFYLQALNYM